MPDTALLAVVVLEWFGTTMSLLAPSIRDVMFLSRSTVAQAATHAGYFAE